MFQNTGPKDKSFLKRSNNICFSLLFCWVFFCFRLLEATPRVTKTDPHPEPRGVFSFLPRTSFRSPSTKESDLKVGACPGASWGDLTPSETRAREPASQGASSLPRALARPQVSERTRNLGDCPVPASLPGDRSALPPRNPGRPEPRGASPGPAFPSCSGLDPGQKCELCPEIRLVGPA